MAGSVWIWSEGRWRRESAMREALAQPLATVGAGGNAGAGKEAERGVGGGTVGGAGADAQSSASAGKAAEREVPALRIDGGPARVAGPHADALEGPSSGDAGFVMPGERSSTPTERRGDVAVSDTSGGAGKASRPADFWLLRGAAQLGETAPAQRSRRAERRTPDSAGGELPATLRERLVQAGVFVWQAAQPLSQLREYAVPVFHLEALAVERIYRHTERRAEALGRASGASDGGNRSPIMNNAHAVAREARRAAAGAYGDDGAQAAVVHEDQPVTYRDPQLRRAARTAIRALYALGLDYGEVRIVLDGEGRAAVRTIMPLAAERLYDAVGRSALRRFVDGYGAARAAQGRESLQIGADPEFVLLRRDGRIVSPARFLDPGDAAG